MNFPNLDTLIGAHLNQDMYILYDSFEAAVADFVCTDPSVIAPLRQEMALFLEYYGSEAEAEFKRRYGIDITLEPGETVAGLFAEFDAIITAESRRPPTQRPSEGSGIEDFPTLDLLFTVYLTHDEASRPESFEVAVAAFVHADPSRIAPLRREMASFLERAGLQAKAEFKGLFNWDFDLLDRYHTVAELFAEIDRVVAAVK